MLLCLSSSARKRYIDDIYRSLSMPSGIYLQFRYFRNYIPSKTFDKLSKNELKGQTNLVAYLDRVDEAYSTTAIPCRFGTIVQSSVAGDICTVVFRVEEYAHSVDLEQTNKELRQLFSNFPEWKETNSSKDVDGYFCGELSSDPSSICGANNLNRDNFWLGIIKQLSQSFKKMASPYEGGTHFYRVEGIFEGTTHQVINMHSAIIHPNDAGIYELNPSSEYTLSVIHKAEQNDLNKNDENQILLESTNGINWLSRCKIDLDSSYDRALLRFETLNTTDKKSLLIEFQRKLKLNDDKSNQTFDFELPMKINSNIRFKVVSVLIITLLLFSQSILESVKEMDGVFQILLSLILSLALALALFFRLPKL